MIGMGQEPSWLLHRAALHVPMGLCLQQKVEWILMADRCTGQKIGSRELLLSLLKKEMEGLCMSKSQSEMVGRTIVEKISIVMADLPYQTVVLFWRDAHAGEGQWHTLDAEDQEPHIIMSCGWLVPEIDGGKKDHVTLVQSVSPDGFADHTLYVPSGMVESVQFLQPFSAPLE
jgi:hypothetical protein